PDHDLGERVTAAIVLRPGAETSSAELIAFCRAELAGFKTPKSVRFLDALPRTGSGKIQKRALRDG
ncbi:MAG: AMP-binding enzyme, partial [Planctomycetota bacterium]